MTLRALDLPAGSVDVLLLKALSWNPMHGYGISRWLKAESSGAFGLEDAALYQGLHRLERQGWVTSEWGASETNRRAKFYSITPQGKRQLREASAAWRAYASALFKVLDASGAKA
ncbi:MAG: PadR family transcriptional regulator [Gemmatimonadales bacterium]|nr:PadR family transcriptional regulator [Gemmatimonadales bacterium]